MFGTFLDLIKQKPEYFYAVNRNFSEYITEDSANEANQVLRKLLLKRIQQEPDLFYNQMLSWLFTQQQEYKKAFKIFERVETMDSTMVNTNQLYKILISVHYNVLLLISDGHAGKYRRN